MCIHAHTYTHIYIGKLWGLGRLGRTATPHAGPRHWTSPGRLRSCPARYPQPVPLGVGIWVPGQTRREPAPNGLGGPPVFHGVPEPGGVQCTAHPCRNSQFPGSLPILCSFPGSLPGSFPASSLPARWDCMVPGSCWRMCVLVCAYIHEYTHA